MLWLKVAESEEKAVGILGIIGEVRRKIPASDPTVSCFELSKNQSAKI